jgi:feruloyl esterase
MSRSAYEYDGYLAGSPDFNLPIAALANIFGAQRYALVATADPSTPAGLNTDFTAIERSMRGRCQDAPYCPQCVALQE